MTNEIRKEAKGKKAEFQKVKPATEGKTTVIHVARTAKVVKGGKRFGFRALVVIGNGDGKVGVAIGKANQVQLAIGKAETKRWKQVWLTVSFGVLRIHPAAPRRLTQTQPPMVMPSSYSARMGRVSPVSRKATRGDMASG